MTKRVVTTLFVIFTCAVLPAWAGDTLDEFLTRIEERSAEIASLSCTFTQEKHLAMFDGPVVFAGRLAMVRPDRLRWEYTSPMPSALIFDGDRGIRCSDRGEAVVFDMARDPVMRAVGEQLRLWLSGDYRGMEDRYSLALTSPDTLTVTPRGAEEREYLASLVITFATATLQPAEVTINEAGGDRTHILFGEPAMNQALPDQLFQSCKADD